MNKILLILLAVSFSFSCSSDDNKKPVDLTGKLKSITYENEQNMYDSIEYTYGKNGFVTSKISYFKIVPPQELTITYKDNNVVKTNLSQMGQNMEVNFSYDRHGNIEQSEFSNSQGSNVYFYRYDSGNLVEETHFINEKGISRINYSFTGKNTVEVTVTSLNTVPPQSSTIIYKYDDKNNPFNNSYPEAYSKATMLLTRNNIISKDGNVIKYEYNAKGYPIKAIENDKVIIYEYY